MRKCLGKHSCMSNSFPIVILNDTSLAILAKALVTIYKLNLGSFDALLVGAQHVVAWVIRICTGCG